MLIGALASLQLAGCHQPNARLLYATAQGDRMVLHYTSDPAARGTEIPRFYLFAINKDSFEGEMPPRQFFSEELGYQRSADIQGSKTDGVGHPVDGPAGGFDYTLPLSQVRYVGRSRFFLIIAWLDKDGKEKLGEVYDVTRLVTDWNANPDEEHTRQL